VLFAKRVGLQEEGSGSIQISEIECRIPCRGSVSGSSLNSLDCYEPVLLALSFFFYPDISLQKRASECLFYRNIIDLSRGKLEIVDSLIDQTCRPVGLTRADVTLIIT
jgi:hypothetical protein